MQNLLTLQLKYPSALTSFDQITAFAKGKRIALFLDYDGTLSPIVDNPDLAFMSESVRIYEDDELTILQTISVFAVTNKCRLRRPSTLADASSCEKGGQMFSHSNN